MMTTANGKHLWKVQIAGLRDNDVKATLRVRGDDWAHAKLRASRLVNPQRSRIFSIQLIEGEAA